VEFTDVVMAGIVNFWALQIEAELPLKAGTEHQITAACKTNLDTHVHNSCSRLMQ
jgi:hypothetical protein